MACDSKGNLKGGLDFLDIVRIHTEYAFDRSSKAQPVSQASPIRGGCLLWEVLRDRTMGITEEG